jgi:hypothetical protein
MPTTNQSRSPHWYGVPLRILVLTFLATLLSFVVSLFFTIIAMLINWKLSHVHPNMATAYRNIAIPCAILGGALAFFFALYNEVRYYRQTKTLAAIERMT